MEALAEAGDHIEVLHRDVSGWSYGRLEDGSKEEGWFPDWVTHGKDFWVSR